MRLSGHCSGVDSCRHYDCGLQRGKRVRDLADVVLEAGFNHVGEGMLALVVMLAVPCPLEQGPKAFNPCGLFRLRTERSGLPCVVHVSASYSGSRGVGLSSRELGSTFWFYRQGSRPCSATTRPPRSAAPITTCLLVARPRGAGGELLVELAGLPAYVAYSSSPLRRVGIVIDLRIRIIRNAISVWCSRSRANW